MASALEEGEREARGTDVILHVSEEEKEYLEEKIEYLDIEPMQGVRGLKALRVPINLYTPVLHAEPTVKGLFKQNN